MNKEQAALYLSWITAVAATSASLYASEVAQLPPCVLCWYQRILMYPLVIILVVGIIKKDKFLPFYVLPLSVLGVVVAFYHNLLYFKILPESTAPCLLGISCTTKFFEWFGFITIPFLSLTAFVVITACMIYLLRRK